MIKLSHKSISDIMNTYYITGEVHGSHVQATDRETAIKTFVTFYNGEKVIHIKLKEGTEPESAAKTDK